MSFFRYAERNLSDSEKDAKEATSLLPSARKPNPKKKHSTPRSAPRVQQRKGRVKVSDADVIPVDTVAYDLDLSLNHKYSSVAYRISAATGVDVDKYEKSLSDYNDFVDKDLKTLFPQDPNLDIFKTLFSGMEDFIKLLDLAGRYSDRWGEMLQRNIFLLAAGQKQIKPMLEAFAVMQSEIGDFSNNDKAKDIFGKPSNGRLISKGLPDKIFGNNSIRAITNARSYIDKFTKVNIDILKRMPDYVIDAIGTERKGIKAINLAVFTRIVGAKDQEECWSVFAAFLNRLENVMKLASFSDAIIDLYMTDIAARANDKKKFAESLDTLLKKLQKDETDQTVSGIKLQGEIFKLTYYKNLRDYLLNILKNNDIKSVTTKDGENIVKETDDETDTEYKKIMVNRVFELYKEYLNDSFKTNITELMEGYEEEEGSSAGDWLDDAINANRKMIKKMDSGKWDEKNKERGKLTREQMTERYEKLYKDMLSKYGLSDKTEKELDELGIPSLEEAIGGRVRTSSIKFQSSNKDSVYRGLYMPRNAAYHGVLMQGHPNGPTNSGWNSIDKRYIDRSHLDSIIASAKKMLKDNPWFQFNWGGGRPDAPFRAALDLAIHTADSNSYQSKIDAPTYEKLLNRLASWDYDTFEDTVLNMPKDPKKRKASVNYQDMADDFDKCQELIRKIKE